MAAAGAGAKSGGGVFVGPPFFLCRWITLPDLRRICGKVVRGGQFLASGAANGGATFREGRGGRGGARFAERALVRA